MPKSGPGLQNTGDLEALILADEVAHRIAAHQNFSGGTPPAAGGQGQKLLGDNTTQHR